MKLEKQEFPSFSFLLPTPQILPLGVQGLSGTAWGRKWGRKGQSLFYQWEYYKHCYTNRLEPLEPTFKKLFVLSCQLVKMMLLHVRPAFMHTQCNSARTYVGTNGIYIGSVGVVRESVYVELKHIYFL